VTTLAKRLPILSGCIALLCLLVSVTASAWLTEYGAVETIQPAKLWALGNSDLWRRAARSSLLSLNDQDLLQGAAAYRQALARNPLDSVAWDGLAALETRLGGDRSAEGVLRGWTAAIPNSPRADWNLANLLLRQGKVDEALPYFQRAATQDASLKAPLFPLAWKTLDDPERILREVVPEDEKSRMDYFNYLAVERADLKAAEGVWQSLRAANSERAPVVGMALAEHLARAGQGLQADRVWRQAAPAAATTAPTGSGERVTNGDFEKPLVNGGLEWLLQRAVGYRVSFDDFTQASGGRSLRVDFAGFGNLDFYEAVQWIVVRPNRDYHFRASIKTNNLNSDSGVYWSLTRSGPPEQEWTTRPQIGTNPWTVPEMDIHTDADTTVLLLRLRRRPSDRQDTQLSGTVWVDAVSLIER
jgi:tetratricopeptide (TPR) repeat protein